MAAHLQKDDDWQNISTASQRSEFNHFSLDGVENTDVNFNTYILLPSVNALQYVL